jgi:hypothetical protein
MNEETEDSLRAVLRDRAQVVSASGDPVVLVEARMRKRFRRRSLGVAGAAAVGVTALAVGVNAFGASRTPTRPVGPEVVASQLSPSAAPSSSRTPSVSSAPTPSGVVAPSGSAAPNVAALQLPPGYLLDTVMAASDGLVVTGTTESTEADPPCVSVPISTAPLSIGVVTTSRCPDSAALGRPIVAVITRSVVAGEDTGSIAIARFDSAVGKTATGPVVMTYSPASDTQPVFAYGGGLLWIYDVDTTNGPEAMAVSLSSGTVQGVVRTPKLYKPVIAANSDGLWLGNSIQGLDLSAPLFRIATGSHTTAAVMSGYGKAVDWLVADEGHVWAGIRPTGGVEETMWRFDGVKAKPVFHAPEPRLPAATSTVVGGESDGLWAAVPYPPLGDTTSAGANKELDVLRIDPDTGAATVEAKLPPLPELAAQTGASPGSIALFDGACFVLEPPFQQGGYLGYSSLARITPLK